MSQDDRRRSLPSVDRVLADPRLAPEAARWSHRVLLGMIRAEIERARRAVAAGADADADAITAAVLAGLEALDEPGPRRVVNATGVVIHTNLGRAPLGAEVLERAVRASHGYCDLEYDLATGDRGSRHAPVQALFELLFPGRAALVVNNNAAAVLLALGTHAAGREVVVSRGELVEIGGSFRVPDILARSGARLVEVGTTNRTHPSDYERAIGPQTAALLKVWPSNYRIVGFTAEVDVAGLARLARPHGLPVIVDQGCGRLFREGPGPASERSVEELLDEGADLVCFSGDKLLGGPQCGVILGRPDLVRACAKDPLTRALRPDKLAIAALAATLTAWLRREPARHLPALHMLDRAPAELEVEARRLAGDLRRAVPGLEVEVVAGISRVGGGAAPGEDLPTSLVAVRAPAGDEALAARLRAGDPPVVVRREDGAVLLDPRTLLPGEAGEVVEAVAAALGEQVRSRPD